jgi:hypothetical protein
MPNIFLMGVIKYDPEKFGLTGVSEVYDQLAGFRSSPA